MLGFMLESFFITKPATPKTYTLSLHDALPISRGSRARPRHAPAPRASPRTARHQPPAGPRVAGDPGAPPRSEEHTSELQSHVNLVWRLLLEKKKLYP